MVIICDFIIEQEGNRPWGGSNRNSWPSSRRHRFSFVFSVTGEQSACCVAGSLNCNKNNLRIPEVPPSRSCFVGSKLVKK